MAYYFSFWNQSLLCRIAQNSGLFPPMGSGFKAICLAICCLLFPLIGSANPDFIEYKAEAYRTFQAIEIDGDLTESDWQNAKRIGQFVQMEPDEGQPMTETTDVRILYDEKNIYFGFTCFDSDISKVAANEMRRDGNLWDNDSVYVLLDTYNDQRSGFFFRVNPLGAMEDVAIMDNGDSRNENWDAVWDCRAKINEKYWTAEIGIPFSQLRFNRSDMMTWGLNMGRSLMRDQEEGMWKPVSRAYGWRARYRTANLGSLVGLEGVAPSRNLELLPYILPGVSRIEADDDTNGEFELGLDVKYGLTSNLTTDLTFNTDFAQVEADEEQVNLTRFSLFFPEKRPFFLEGAGLFDVGIPRTSFRRPPPLLLFYSRRIGLAEEHAVPIITGGKITGKVGPYGIGLLNVFTDKFHTDASVTDPDEIVDEPRTNYSVLRMRRDFFSGSTVGLIAVNKQNADTYNRAGGFDITYRPSDNINVRGLWARTYEDDVSEQRDAWYFGGNWQNGDLRLSGSYIDIGENFNPEVGFVQRQDVRRIRSEARFTPRLGKFGIRGIWAGPEFDLILNRNNELATREFRYMNWFELEGGGWVGFQAQRTFERLDEDFEIRDDLTIPIGEYHFNSFRASISTDDTKMVSIQLGTNFGDFFDGERVGFDIGPDFKPNGHFSFEPRFQFNRVTLPEGSFDASIFGARVSYAFSTRFFTKLFAQWNSDDGVISTNFLLNYIYRPGSDFYLVFNQIYDSSDSGAKLEESTFVGKMTYWWNP